MEENVPLSLVCRRLRGSIVIPTERNLRVDNGSLPRLHLGKLHLLVVVSNVANVDNVVQYRLRVNNINSAIFKKYHHMNKNKSKLYCLRCLHVSVDNLRRQYLILPDTNVKNVYAKYTFQEEGTILDRLNSSLQ